MSSPVITAYRLNAATGMHRGDRQYQQDQVDFIAHGRVPGCALAVLADGMGGKSGGRKAADQVIMVARQLYERFVPEKDDPADVARTGYEAMLRGDGDVVSGWHNKLQSAIANVTPSAVLAEQHRRMAEPGSGRRRN